MSLGSGGGHTVKRLLLIHMFFVIFLFFTPAGAITGGKLLIAAIMTDS